MIDVLFKDLLLNFSNNFEDIRIAIGISVGTDP